MSETSSIATLVPRRPVEAWDGGPGDPGRRTSARRRRRGSRPRRHRDGRVSQPALEKTAETVDSDGWLHSGDIGRIDADGFLSIIDRKKELIINAAGKNMSPANIEQQLKKAAD